MNRPLLAIIQARMGSTRLPGKSLRNVSGLPLIMHVVERLKKSRRITRIVVATSTEAADTPLAQALTAAGVAVVRGSEQNVLERFALAAQNYSGDYLVRVTGDAPFVDAVAIDRMVDTLTSAGADFFSLIKGESPIHEGFEVFSRTAFERLLKDAGSDPVAMEHVTGYFKQHPDFVTSAPFTIPGDEQFAGARMSVDTPADVLFVETIYERLGCSAPFADIRDVVALLRKDASLLEINRHVHQKSLTEKAIRIGFVCESGGTVGYGHLARTVALAEVMRDRFSAAVSLWIIGDEVSVSRGRTKGFRVSRVSPDNLYDTLLNDRLDVAVIDVLTRVSVETLDALKNAGIKSVLIDDGSDRRLIADQTFYGEVPQVDKMCWDGARGEVFRGFDYAIVNQVFETHPNRVPHEKLRVLVSMGGSDPAGFTTLALRALRRIESQHAITVTVVIGPGFTHTSEIHALGATLRSEVVYVHDPENLSVLMAQADMGVIAFGVTAYEAAAVELPCVYLCLSEDHAQSATPFAQHGMGVVGGVCLKGPDNCDNIDVDELTKTIDIFASHVPHIFAPGSPARDLAQQVRQGTRHVAETIMKLRRE